MKTLRALFFVMLLVFLPLSAQRRERKVVELKDVAQPVEMSEMSSVARDYRATSARYITAARSAESGYPQAPGIVQFNLFDPARVTWFVTTETLPAGTIIAPYWILPGQYEFPLESWELTESLEPGVSLTLPSLRWLGDFWPAGVVTYDVVVDMGGGKVTHAAADYVSGDARRNIQDLAEVVPLISWVAQLGTAEKPELLIQGNFSSDPPKLLLEDLVVPPEAIKSAQPWSITVDLTKVPGVNLGLLQEFLVSVAQGGWCDTLTSFRYVPRR